MNKVLLFFLISILIYGCKSKAFMTGKYQTNNEPIYVFDMRKNKYSKMTSNHIIFKGNFKVLRLSPEKTLIVLDNKILKNIRHDINELNKVSDSIIFKSLGSTVFEITSKENLLTFRKTYSNLLQNTESEGVLIKIIN